MTRLNVSAVTSFLNRVQIRHALIFGLAFTKTRKYLRHIWILGIRQLDDDVPRPQEIWLGKIRTS